MLFRIPIYGARREPRRSTALVCILGGVRQVAAFSRQGKRWGKLNSGVYLRGPASPCNRGPRSPGQSSNTGPSGAMDGGTDLRILGPVLGEQHGAGVTWLFISSRACKLLGAGDCALTLMGRGADNLLRETRA